MRLALQQFLLTAAVVGFCAWDTHRVMKYNEEPVSKPQLEALGLVVLEAKLDVAEQKGLLPPSSPGGPSK